ncbi:phosphoribosyl-AMP cyclohydrolase [Leptospira sp. 2 VSF19]|uniref:phosphoribosyl-AMP cyclohydrolase n=1 Tax=Leptospira soteropolitanensis TaxID=2950025 RepID=A0AAW5VIB4_9LEPT|nr:phosphoribosyl-AMP cyclohydrolase [Leptospira soteropolitanensis]MCW7491384.1 phosphoribosyl-AMP cyclohydrolase [Leptospira soteropolitanensis]MCW7498969.1 phosphoribosyl-AMP cyclohydrolase [Leptospira soteropolitanensis]MCW7521439.1 phosphoribosyl-AMP cyclohydrolase [Leptospira soteropolitanensis]MCW7525072.1 phosphoribosyl-AMP cyclohydrolase [Leptospira soteropolitanensis]MCW7528940.1 phosphoribosyl-AMP cyclohydrolase [Leptospira soteropolitanensis]
MIQLPKEKEITIISKPSIDSNEVSLKVVNSDLAQDIVNHFDFDRKQLFIDCDEDALLEIDPSLKTFNKLLLWESGSLKLTEEEWVSFQNTIPLLSPFLAQDKSGKDLMLAWGKKDSLLSAVTTGLGTYYSRSRQGKWVKGEESGHLQNLSAIYVHSNPFFVQYVTSQIGAACHTGYYSCFFRKLGPNDSISFVYKSKVGA